MKEASGELSLTLIAVIAIGAVLALFNLVWPSLKEKIKNGFGGVESGVDKINGAMKYDFTDYVETELF